MQNMNDARPDLNLLVVFDAIARHGSVTGAARALNLSQPAVSHALARLRDLTGDRLFIRQSGRMVQTARADAMAGEARTMVEAARALLASPGFDPATSLRLLRIAASDYALQAVVPKLTGMLASRAPGVDLALRPVGPETLAQLADGQIEASFWAGAAPGGPWMLWPLFVERLVGVCPADHPFAGASAIDLEAWAGMRHAVVSLGDPGPNAVETALAAAGLRRRVALVSHSFTGVMAALGPGRSIMALPERLLPMARRAGLSSFDLPLDLPGYPYGILRHARTRAEPALDWLERQTSEYLVEQTDIYW